MTTENSTETALNKTPADAPQSPAAPEAQTSPESPPQSNVAPANQQDDPHLTKRFLALGKKEKLLREEARKEKQQLAAERERLEKEQAELKAWKEEMNALDSDPLAVLEKRGWNYEKLTDHVLNRSNTANPRLEKELAETRQMINALVEEKKKEQEENAKLQAEQVQLNYIKNIYSEINKNPDKYELVIAENAYNSIFEIIKARYIESFEETEGRNPQLLSVDEVAEEYENYLYSEEVKRQERIRQLKKFAPIQPKTETKIESKEEEPRITKKTRTLSNSDFNERTVKVIDSKVDKLDDGLKRAAALLKFK